MGLDINGSQFMLYAKAVGADFTRTAMIGRQTLQLKPHNLQANFAKFGYDFDESSIQRIFRKDERYAEEFFRSIGAQTIDSFDNSDYEGATHIHDMNQAITQRDKHKYSVVCDGGSLEHVFNFPTALKNCMEMVEVGGHYLGITPANNFMGHGFYQFSPELFYSAFTEENGYELNHLIAFEDTPRAEWFSVQSPSSVQGRVTLTNSKPVFLLIMAKRVADVIPFQSPPQQSDYMSAWSAESGQQKNAADAKKNSLLKTAIRYTPRSIKSMVKRQLRHDRRHVGFNPRFFQPIRRTEAVETTTDNPSATN